MGENCLRFDLIFCSMKLAVFFAVALLVTSTVGTTTPAYVVPLSFKTTPTPSTIASYSGVKSVIGVYGSLALVEGFSSTSVPSTWVRLPSPASAYASSSRMVIVGEYVTADAAESVPMWVSAVSAVVDGLSSASVVGKTAFGVNMVVDVSAADVETMTATLSALSGPGVMWMPVWQWMDLATAHLSAGYNASLARVQGLVEGLDAPNPVIIDMMDKVDTGNLRASLEYLTGVSSDITTRNSFSADAPKVATWLKGQMDALGYETEIMPFKTGYGPNVIATIKGELDAMVVLGAHYDSRSRDVNSPTNPAPGADDDGSGTATLLEVARVLAQTEVQFKYSITIMFFCGEEQGLVGSSAIANKLNAEKADIVAMVQNDMQAYRPPNAPVEIALMERGATPILNEAMVAVYQLYLPNVRVCYSSACCSDQQSFSPYWPAAAQFETCSPSVIDPAYHSTDDIINRPGFDIEGELYTQVKALVAVAATFLDAQ